LPTNGTHTLIRPNNPLSDGYAAVSPKGEVLELADRQKRSAHYALSSGFQLAQVSDLLGWNDVNEWAEEVV